MVLYKDGSYVTNSTFPDTDFMENADYIIPDGSEIAEKIISLYPNFEIVEDGSGNIADVAATEPIITSEQIKTRKAERIQESKVQLAQWLNSNPFLYTDGNYYSCTEEKQALLNGNLASYERATKAGIEYPLKWNSTGDECKLWEYADLLELSLSIAAYVAPKVSQQQSIELQIKACETIDEINAIEINYDE